jgi:hypothetical protein
MVGGLKPAFAERDKKQTMIDLRGVSFKNCPSIRLSRLLAQSNFCNKYYTSFPTYVITIGTAKASPHFLSSVIVSCHNIVPLPFLLTYSLILEAVNTGPYSQKIWRPPTQQLKTLCSKSSGAELSRLVNNL